MWNDALPILDSYMEENGDFMLGNLRYSYARERVPELFSGIIASVSYTHLDVYKRQPYDRRWWGRLRLWAVLVVPGLAQHSRPLLLSDPLARLSLIHI